MFKKELHILLTAVMFFTRIPCPKQIDHSPEMLTKSSRYFSLMGWIVGGFGACIFWTSTFLFPKEIALLLSMASTIWLTGAFHEDGFADICDGFGGGWTKDKILTIMKDSRLGTYGTVGLILLLALKFFALHELPNETIILSIISGHALSRFFATTLTYSHPYVQDIEKSKVKPSTVGITLKDVTISGIFGLLPLLLFQTPWVFVTLITCYLSKWKLGNFFTKWIGGHTGDCAGAVQQVTEVVFYLTLIALWKYI